MYYPKIVVSTHKICRDYYISSSGRENMSFYMFFCLAMVVVGDGHLRGERGHYYRRTLFFQERRCRKN